MRGVYGTGRPKLTDQDKLFICVALLSRRYSIAAIARQMDVSPKTIHNVRKAYLPWHKGSKMIPAGLGMILRSISSAETATAR